MRTRRNRIFSYFISSIILTAGIVLSLTGCQTVGYQGEGKEKEQSPAVEKAAIPEANRKYPNANDNMVYFVSEEENKVEQWSLDGNYIKSYVLSEDEELWDVDVLFVNNNELLWGALHEGMDKYLIMQTPIQKTKWGERPQTEKTKKLLTLEEEDAPEGGFVMFGIRYPCSIFANSDYIVFFSSDSGKLITYDRKTKKKKVVHKDCFFSPYALSAVSEVCGDQIIFNTSGSFRKPGEKGYDLSIYRFGDNRARQIDDRCFANAAFVVDSVRNKAYYQIRSDSGIWEYDCRTEKKREIISEKELRSCYERNGLVWEKGYYNDSLFLDEDRLYFVKNKNNPLIFSFVRKEDTFSCHYEKELTELVHSEINDAIPDNGTVMIALLEGKLLLQWCDSDVNDHVVCIDIRTKTGQRIGNPGIYKPNLVYFALIGAWENPETIGLDETISFIRYPVWNSPFADDEKYLEEEQLSEERQLSFLSQCSDQWYEGNPHYYAVTDLDQNGKLELIASTGLSGSGLFTFSDLYQIAPDGRTLRRCIPEFPDKMEPSLFLDIVDGIDTAYRDPQTGNYYYIASDAVSGGAGGHACYQESFSLQDGMLTETIFAYQQEWWNEKKQTGGFHFYRCLDGKDREISEKQYQPEKLAEKYFAGYEKRKVNIKWVQFHKKKKNLSEKEIRRKLAASYHAFHV